MKFAKYFSLQFANAVIFEKNVDFDGDNLQAGQPEAQAMCERKGGNLAFFKNEGEYSTFSNDYQKWKPVRIGYTRASENDTFTAINGDPDVYTSFWRDNLLSYDLCLLSAKTQKKKFTDKKMFPHGCENNKMSWCRFEEEQNSMRNGHFLKYEAVEGSKGTVAAAEAYCESKGGFLPYEVEKIFDGHTWTFNEFFKSQLTGIRRNSKGVFVDKINRELTIDEIFWSANEPSSIEGADCVQIIEDGESFKLKMASCTDYALITCRYNQGDCRKDVVNNARQQVTVGQMMQLQDLKCSGTDTWRIVFEFKCKNDNMQDAEDIVLITDNLNPSVPFLKVHRPANDYAYQISMPKMSEATTVHAELFNPYPGHAHIWDQSSASPKYQTWMCSGVRGRGYVRLEIDQRYCNETGLYTKSLTWNGYERMRLTDTVPTIMKDLAFFMGGNSSPPTRVKDFYVGDEASTWSGGAYSCEQRAECVKPDGSTVPYGHVEWKYPLSKSGQRRKFAKCICFENGKFECVGNRKASKRD